MPRLQSINKLYKIQEIIGRLRLLLGKNPIALIHERAKGEWNIKICEGSLVNPIFMGHLCLNNEAHAALFNCKEDAFNSIKWCRDSVDIIFQPHEERF